MTMDPTWEEKLAPLVERDQFVREALDRRGILSDAYHPEMEKVHLENSKKLKALIEKRGFPVLSNAGDKGVRLAWLIIQHSISSPDFMQECMVQMRLAAVDGDWPRDLLAYTEDCVRFFEGKGQLYGTFVDWQEGELKPTLVEDPDLLDYRRKSAGLPPMAEAMAKFSISRPPKDPAKKLQEFTAWLKRVGWRS